MWMKLRYLMFACILWMSFAAGGSVQAADASKSAEKPDRIELVLVIDQSGSMHGLEKDTIGGFNAMIEKQKKLDVPVYVTAVLFNDKMDVLYERREIQRVKPLTEEDYAPGGTTALLDAVGSTILKVDQAGVPARKGTKMIFVIITDGLENASVEFTKKKVKTLISDKQEKEGWDFVYLGANIDAAEEADAIGVQKTNAVTYRNTKSGVRANYDAVSAYVAEAAEGTGNASGAWKDHVEQDTSK